MVQYFYPSNQTKPKNLTSNISLLLLLILSLSLAIELQPKEYPQWSIEHHNRAPKTVKDLVLTMTMIRSIALWSLISLLPNELLFLIFEHLDFETILRLRDQRRRLQQPLSLLPSHGVRPQGQLGRSSPSSSSSSSSRSRELDRVHKQKCHVM